MHVKVRRHRPIDRVEKAAELLGAMARGHVGDDLPGSDVKRGVEVGGAVAYVVVRLALGHPGHQRQGRRRAIERLDLGLLIHAHHDGGIGRVEIQPDDVSDLVDELRIGRELERFGLLRLEPERPPDATDRGLAHPRRGGHRARRPVRRVWRALLKRLDDHTLDVIIADRPRLARTRLVVQPVQTAPREPPAPAPDSLRAAAQPRRDVLAGLAVTRRQHDPAAQRQRLRARRSPRPPLEHLPLLATEHNLHTLRHRGLQSSSMTTTFADVAVLPSAS